MSGGQRSYPKLSEFSAIRRVLKSGKEDECCDYSQDAQTGPVLMDVEMGKDTVMVQIQSAFKMLTCGTGA